MSGISAPLQSCDCGPSKKKTCIPWRCWPCHKWYGSYTVFFIIMKLHVPLNAKCSALLFRSCSIYMPICWVGWYQKALQRLWLPERQQKAVQQCSLALWTGLRESTALLFLLWAGRPLVKATLGVAVEGTVKMCSNKICSSLELLN